MQCTATSQRTGQQCRRDAWRGASVCGHHGASAPQVRDAAARRLSTLVEPAVEALADALDQGGHVAMHAARIIVAASVQHGWEDARRDS